MAKHLQIDFVSDVSCPWCVIGLIALEQAIARVGDDVEVTMQFQPFELNPDMPRGGQDITEHIAEKYGSTPAQSAANREMIRARGFDLGFTFDMQHRGRIYYTFDAHRLLHWAGLEGRQQALKEALFKAYFTDGQDPSSHAVLLRLVGEVGLDAAAGAQILATDAYGADVRELEQFYQGQGISSVPAIIINDRHLISGGQAPAVFEQALRQIIASN